MKPLFQFSSHIKLTLSVFAVHGVNHYLITKIASLCRVKPPYGWLQSVGSQAPAMAGHTMTLDGDQRIWIIGGFSPFSYFTESVYVLDLNDAGAVWTEVEGQQGTKPVGE